jgi:hypothetical protein
MEVFSNDRDSGDVKWNSEGACNRIRRRESGEEAMRKLTQRKPPAGQSKKLHALSWCFSVSALVLHQHH